MSVEYSSIEVPLVFQVDELLDFFREHPELVTVENFGTASSRVGRVNTPALMFDLFCSQLLSPEMLTEVIGGVWSSAEYPGQTFGPGIWQDLFDAAGYTVEGKAAERPSEVLTLFRGATPEYRRGMSWTDSREIAEKFATGDLNGRQPGKLYTAKVEPWRLLAKVTDREESEYVVNTKGLRIFEVQK